MAGVGCGTGRMLAAYAEREGEALGTDYEVVLFYGESEDDLRKTHSRYFIKRKRTGNGGVPRS